MRAVLVVLALAASGGVAHAQQAAAGGDPGVCADSTGDPVPLSLRDFAAIRSACLRSDVDVRLSGHALVDAPDFYGTLGGDLDVALRFYEHLGFEWGLTLQLVDVTFAQTAVLSETEASYGPVTGHIAGARWLPGGVRAGGELRAEIPFTRSILDASAAGAQLAGLATIPVHPLVLLHARAAALGWYGSSSGGTTTRGAGALSGDASIRALPWLRAVAGLELQAGWYGGLDHLAVRLGAHWRVRGPWRLDVGGLMPLVGDDRTDVAFTLGVRRDR